RDDEGLAGYLFSDGMKESMMDSGGKVSTPVERCYVEDRDGGYAVAGTRVSLDSIIYAFLRGESPEGIVESFPSLSLEQVFVALAFYLANRDSIEEYLREEEVGFERMRAESRRRHPAFYAKLDGARQSSLTP